MRLLLVLLLFSCSHGETKRTAQPEIFALYSPEVKDSFTVRIKKPKNFSPDSSYQIVYTADGSLKLGNYIMGTDSSWSATLPPDCIVVTIAHIGDWHKKRQRDFLPSDAGGYSDENFGQARNFYLFLKNTLIPLVNKKVGKPKQTSFIGHSFSGLFCLYTIFQEDKLFDHHFAISPSVWANYGELMKIEKNYFDTKKELKATVDLQAGGLEFLNKVLSSTKEFFTTTKSRNYAGYQVEFSTVSNANHYSIIKPGVDKALLKLSN